VTTQKACQHLRNDHVVPGWICCKCRIYNGYQREVCRNCHHAACYETKSAKGKEALELKPIGHDRAKVVAWIEAKLHPTSNREAIGTDDTASFCSDCRSPSGPCKLHDCRGPLGNKGEPGKLGKQ
jgi:hypothetical protein